MYFDAFTVTAGISSIFCFFADVKVFIESFWNEEKTQLSILFSKKLYSVSIVFGVFGELGVVGVLGDDP